MIVEDFYSIDVDALYNKTDNSAYWESCEKFYEDVRLRHVDELSIDQTDWLEKIESDLEN